jgi:hypothetical protein
LSDASILEKYQSEAENGLSVFETAMKINEYVALSE